VEPNSVISFGGGALLCDVLGPREDIPVLTRVRFNSKGEELLDKFDKLGRPIMSAYVSRNWGIESYQTPHANARGSAEMPAAGRHFTTELLSSLQNIGVKHYFITLHTGLSSFKIAESKFEDHKMYEEYCELTDDTAEALADVKMNGGRVLAVGTTAVRTLESAAKGDGTLRPFGGYTDLYIYPGYKWKAVDMLCTNFHGPKTTRIALAASFTGQDLLMKGYKEAIERRYRFYEFGDTTLTI
jgi:S-adenosylmethionine:tRNA ribosyltransferase-isomerase